MCSITFISKLTKFWKIIIEIKTEDTNLPPGAYCGALKDLGIEGPNSSIIGKFHSISLTPPIHIADE